MRSFCSSCAISIVFAAMLRLIIEWLNWNLRWLGRERRVLTSDRNELNGGSSSVVLDWSASGREIANCNPGDRGGVAPGIMFMGLLVDCKGEVGVWSGEAELESILQGDEIKERKTTTGLEVKCEPEGVKYWKSSSGSETIVLRPRKRI